MFLTWITITAEISKKCNLGITNMAKGGHICGHIDGYVTTRFGNLSRFETGTSHFATSMVLSWDAHLETHNTLF